MTDRLITLREASDRTGLSVMTLRRRHASGDLPVVKTGKAVRIREADLQALIDRSVVRGGTAA